MIPLLLLTFGVSEYGRAIYQYNTLAKGVRDAARYLSQQAPGDANAIAKAKNLAVYGNTTGSGSPLAPGLTPGMVSICDRLSCPGDHNLQSTGKGAVNLVTVSISGYTFVPVVTLAMPRSITFENIGATMAQVL